MIFNAHSELKDRHSFLSPSKSAWTNYDIEKLDRVFFTHLAAQRGTELHALANDLIRLGVKLPRAPKTLNMYVNDALGFRMSPEQTLYFLKPNAIFETVFEKYFFETKILDDFRAFFGPVFDTFSTSFSDVFREHFSKRFQKWHIGL